jgi:hypothetical protein
MLAAPIAKQMPTVVASARRKSAMPKRLNQVRASTADPAPVSRPAVVSQAKPERMPKLQEASTAAPAA